MSDDDDWVIEEQEDGEEGGEEDDSQPEMDDGCQKCHEPGELLLCDYCPKGYHIKCAGLKHSPGGICIFSCNDCGTDKCDSCKGKKAIIRCRYCRRTYHDDCLPRVPSPEDLWLCPKCQQDLVSRSTGGIDKILTSRPYRRIPTTEIKRRLDGWAELAKKEAAENGGIGGSGSGSSSSNSKKGGGKSGGGSSKGSKRVVMEHEFLVRWTGKAYWHCSWVPESFLAETAKMKLKNFKLRQTESREIQIEGEAAETEDEEVINPSRCQVDRVLDERKERSLDGKSKVTEYLVKWMGLEYDESTWELQSDLMEKGFEGPIKHFQRRHQDWLKALEGDLGLPSDPPGKRQFHSLPKQPSFFVGGTWHDYQLDGINFLRNAWYVKNNVILADEMGLGKTIQTIGFLRSIAVENKQKFLPFMVVCPLAVVDNWEREFKVWTPEVDVAVYKGSSASREMIQRYEVKPIIASSSSSSSSASAAAVAASAKERPTKKRRKGPAPTITITSGGRVTRGSSKKEEDESVESEEGTDSEEGGEGARVEGMSLKRKRCGNHEEDKLDVHFHVLITSFEFAAKDACFLRKLRWEVVAVDEGHRLKGGATGKLYKALDNFRVGHRLLLTGTPLQNSLEELFNLLHFLEPEKFAEVETFKADFASMDREAQLAKLRDLIAPHMLRRLKKDVNLQIPEKHELVVRVELSEVQKTYYRLILTQNFELLRKKFKAASSIYNMIMQLKKVCNHPFLLQDREDDLEDEAGNHEARVKELISSSGKLELLDRMLKKLKRDGHRVLLFSQMTSMLDLLEEYLVYSGMKYQRLDGGTRATDRQSRIDAFNRSSGKGDEEYFVFLLSTRAGGLGINLTSADTVIIYDLDWNPHNDLQALARAHRIGQTKKVMIYRFLMRNSVEERILQLAKKKLLLEHVVVGEAGRGRKLTQEELDDVLKYGAEELFEEEAAEFERGKTGGGGEGEGAIAQDEAAAVASGEAMDVDGGDEEGTSANQAGARSNARKWGDGNSSGKERRIYWDDDAVERLLDRESLSEAAAASAAVGAGTIDGRAGGGGGGAEGDGGKAGEGGGLSELFQSFKVARFASIEEEAVAEKVVEEEGDAEDGGKDDGAKMEIDEEKLQEIIPANTNKTWSELLEKRFESMQVEEAARLGKGKRERRGVQRLQGTIDGPLAYYLSGSDVEEEDYEGSSSHNNGVDSDGEYRGSRGTRRRGGGGGGGAGGGGGGSGKRGPHIQGFGELQRRCIRTFLMHFGLMGGDWRTFHRKLMSYSKGKLADRTMADIKRYIKSMLISPTAAADGGGGSGGGGSVSVDGAATTSSSSVAAEGGQASTPTAAAAAAAAPSSGGAADPIDPVLLRRIAVMELIDNKVREYEGTDGDSFSIDDGRQTGWNKGFSITSRFFKFNWNRAQDLLLLRMTLKYGYGNWKLFLRDKEFLASCPASVAAASVRNGGVGNGEGGGNGLEEVDDGGGGGGAGEDGEDAASYTEGQVKHLIGLITKRMKIMAQALAVEKQRLLRKTQAVASVQTHVVDIVEREMEKESLPLLPADLADQVTRREELKARIEELYQRAVVESTVEAKQRVLEVYARGDSHQGLLAESLRKNTELIQLIHTSRSQLMLGVNVFDRLETQLKELEGLQSGLGQGLALLRQDTNDLEVLLEGLFSQPVVFPPPPPPSPDAAAAAEAGGGGAAEGGGDEN